MVAQKIRIERVLALPREALRIPGTIYLVRNPSDNPLLEVYVVGNIRSTVSRVPTIGDIENTINEIIAGLNLEGPPGPQGPPGNALMVVAAEPLGGHRVVTASGFLCGPENANAAVGITKTASVTGDTSEVVVQGIMEEASWSWTPEAPIFVGSAGVLTQTTPSSGLIRRVGWATSPTTINVDFLPPITQA